MATLLFACSSKQSDTSKATETREGVGKAQRSAASTFTNNLEITPSEATRQTILHLISRGFDFSQAKIEWLVNNRPFTTLEPMQFIGADVAKGDRIQARVTLQNQVLLSNIVQINNSPPEITSFKLLPEEFKPGDTFSVATEGNDIDGDNVSFVYEWTRNGARAGNAQNLEGPVKRGDKLSVKVTPFDGESYGTPVIVQREIKNMPPVIKEHTAYSFDGKMYTYQVKADDPDGDALVFSLESPPMGMTIDSSIGLVTWLVPADFQGQKDISIVVNDGNGGIAKYSLKITIR